MSMKHSKRSAWSRSTTSRIDILAVAALSCLVLCQCAKHSDQKEDELYIRDSERQWAESVASGDASVVERILANDFIGVDPHGRTYNKAKMIANTREGPKLFVSNQLNEVKIRFYGDTAVAQGSEAWERRTGERGRFVWTDTWIRRHGRWEIVAAEDLTVPEPGAVLPQQ
jgi:ketosteroid isomerase-like protein